MRPAVSIARSLTCTPLSLARCTPTRQKPNCRPVPRRSTRPFSVTPSRAKYSKRREQSDLDDEEQRPPREDEIQDAHLDPEVLKEADRDVDDIDRQTPPVDFDDKPPRRRGIFAEDEEEDELATEEDDEIADDAITSMAHTQLEEHREQREYARIIAWDMPSLSSFAQPFSLPAESHVLRFRYTTYMGESHPAEPKVVMEVCTKDLTPTYLTEEQRTTLTKLLGARYNPQKDLVRMSCEKFPSSAQNKRYLGDLINTLITEAKKGDSFADVPLDTRHHKPKPKVLFPSSWIMTEERRTQLQATRDERKKAELERLNNVVDGNEAIAAARNPRGNQLAEGSSSDDASKGEKVTVPAGGRTGNNARRLL